MSAESAPAKRRLSNDETVENLAVKKAKEK